MTQFRKFVSLIRLDKSTNTRVCNVLQLVITFCHTLGILLASLYKPFIDGCPCFSIVSFEPLSYISLIP
jgi:hypothetical protein